jgi:uncharacterized protein YdcH (DUF465 family)
MCDIEEIVRAQAEYNRIKVKQNSLSQELKCILQKFGNLSQNTASNLKIELLNKASEIEQMLENIRIDVYEAGALLQRVKHKHGLLFSKK